ncbi:tetratricopeptide repeat protein [Herbaspirillum sp. GCM10030257]|uniref:tetratricopeptide repeat protein n=1 Tax=Herbaspirillum sp. GCM10030257 TaxID=3273393 RepID=UPI00360F0A9C
MSLINQMLKDLDARRSEVTGTDSYGQQIRAVPDRKGLHPAWWVAGSLAIVSSSLLGWVLLRTPVVGSMSDAKLFLKPDTATSANAPGALPTAESRKTLALPAAANATSMPVPAIESSASQMLAPDPALIRAQAVPQGVNVPSKPSPSVAAEVTESPKANQAPKAKPVISPSDAVVVKAAEVQHPESVRDKRGKPVDIPEPERIKPVSAGRPAVNTSTTQGEAPSQANAGKQIKEFTPQQRAENEYRKSVDLLQQGRTTEAVAGLDNALQLDPRHAAARQTLVGVLIENRRTEDALLIAREGIVIDPAQPGLAMILARLQLEKGELRSAIETLDRSLVHARERADYLAFLAALLQRDGQHRKAADQYLLALQKSPQNGVWWMGLGISLQAEQKMADAQEAFRRAKSSNGLSPELQAFVDARLSQLQR